MKVLAIILIVIVVLAILYFLMIMPRMIHKPDTALLQNGSTPTEACTIMQRKHRRTPWRHSVRLRMRASVLNWTFS